MRSEPRFRCAVILVAWGLAGPVSAALGGSRASVDADRAHMAASLTSSTSATYTRHALTLPNGAVVNEFARADGTVFAITWRGPSRPDLRQLLGSRFETLQADNAVAIGHRTRRPLTVDRSDFIVHGGGHSGAFRGMAYLPGEAPAGFSPSALTH